jgi:hypothetical protein
VADSDKDSPESALKPRLERLVVEAASKTHAEVWVTAGRTIENYLPVTEVSEAIKRCHPSVAFVISPANEWERALRARAEGSDALFEVDKVKVARDIASHGVDLSVLDLQERVREVVARIQAANE